MKKEDKVHYILIAVFGVLFLVLIFVLYKPFIFPALPLPAISFSLGNFALFNPQGTIALAEKQIIIAAVLLMLVIVIPVFILLFIVARKYKAGNSRILETNTVDGEKHSRILMILWWLAPASIVFFLAILTWTGAHALDPYKPIQSTNPTLHIQVVALDWKWLFIYPDEHIATVNFLEIPVNTPVHFDLTADNAPMNSFWIPELSGQMYAMTGMSSQLNIMANTAGDYSGSSAEMSGAGFAGMRFNVAARSQEDFNAWIKSVQQSSPKLDQSTYDALVKPSENVSPTSYSAIEDRLYNAIIMKYMPSSQ